MTNSQNKLLFDAVDNSDIEGVRKAIEAGADVNSKPHIYELTPLHVVKSVEIAGLLLNAGANVNTRDNHHRYTPLHRQKNPEII